METIKRYNDRARHNYLKVRQLFVLFYHYIVSIVDFDTR